MTELYSLSKKRDELNWSNPIVHRFPKWVSHFNKTLTLYLGGVEIIVLNSFRAKRVGTHMIQIVKGPEGATGQTELKPDDGQTYYEFAGRYNCEDTLFRLCHAAGTSVEH